VYRTFVCFGAARSDLAYASNGFGGRGRQCVTPTTYEDAVALAKEDRYNFQFWALGLVGDVEPSVVHVAKVNSGS
jgi:hypothetical protein